MAKVNITLLVTLDDDMGDTDGYPSVLDCWDEYSLDANPAGFEERIEELEAEHGRVVQVRSWYDDTEVMKALASSVEGRPEGEVRG